jgi:hypothetical protein
VSEVAENQVSSQAVKFVSQFGRLKKPQIPRFFINNDGGAPWHAPSGDAYNTLKAGLVVRSALGIERVLLVGANAQLGPTVVVFYMEAVVDDSSVSGTYAHHHAVHKQHGRDANWATFGSRRDGVPIFIQPPCQPVKPFVILIIDKDWIAFSGKDGSHVRPLCLHNEGNEESIIRLYNEGKNYLASIMKVL